MGALILVIISFILLSIYACLRVASIVDREDEKKTFNEEDKDDN